MKSCFELCFIDEADSYMYQTVGSHLIESIAQCLNLPLIVKELSGTQISRNFTFDKIWDRSGTAYLLMTVYDVLGFPKSTDSLEYSQTEGDEVEDLYELLKIAKVGVINYLLIYLIILQ